jgi:hypothetical protein
MKVDPSSESEGLMNNANVSNSLDELLQTIETSQSYKSSTSCGSSNVSSKKSCEGLSLNHLLQNIEHNTSQNSWSQKSHELIHECSNSFIDGLFRGDEDDARDVSDVQESLSDASAREESTCAEDETDGSSTQAHQPEKQFQSESCDSLGGSSGDQDIIKEAEGETNGGEQQREKECVESCKQLEKNQHIEHSSFSVEQATSKESNNLSANQSPQPSFDASSIRSPPEEATITAVLAAVSSNVSSVEEKAKWSSLSKATHANDVLVQIEVSSDRMGGE